jgi:hypothetical protein
MAPHLIGFIEPPALLAGCVCAPGLVSAVAPSIHNFWDFSLYPSREPLPAVTTDLRVQASEGADDAPFWDLWATVER